MDTELFSFLNLTFIEKQILNAVILAIARKFRCLFPVSLEV